MATSFRESLAKRAVREQWDTPLLRHLNAHYGVRYRYLGLPGTELADIRLWKDMLDEVIAFQLPAPGGDPRRWILELRTNLRVFGIRSITYFGSFEEVVVLRKDLDGQKYSQDKVITLYNLDFCDEIASRVTTRDGEKAWRFEALRTIIHDQAESFRRTDEASHFIILLTVRNQISAGRIRQFLVPRYLAQETHTYCRECMRIRRIPRRGPLVGSHAWALKAFLYNTLRSYFGAPNISALFFPLVKYSGTPVRLNAGRRLASPMLHWIIVCRFGPPEAPTPDCFPNDFLSSVVSLEAGASGMAFGPEPGERQNQGQPLTCVEWFERQRPAAFDFASIAGPGR